MKHQDYILCVDDDEDDCLLLEEAIKKSGRDIRMKFLPSAEEAIAFLSRALNQFNLPKLIILDINMPRMNGTDLLSEIRDTLNINIPAIILTTHPRDKDILLGERNGASLLVKPSSLQNYDVIVETIFNSLWDLPKGDSPETGS